MPKHGMERRLKAYLTGISNNNRRVDSRIDRENYGGEDFLAAAFYLISSPILRRAFYYSNFPF